MKNARIAAVIALLTAILLQGCAGSAGGPSAAQGSATLPALIDERAPSDARAPAASASGPQSAAPGDSCTPGAIELTSEILKQYGAATNSGSVVTFTAGSDNKSIGAAIGLAQTCNPTQAFAVAPSAQCTPQLLYVNYAKREIYVYPVALNGSCTIIVTGAGGITTTVAVVVDVPAVALTGPAPSFTSATMPVDVMNVNKGNNNLTYGLTSDCGQIAIPVLAAGDVAVHTSVGTQNGTCSFTITGWNASTQKVPVKIAVAAPTETVTGNDAKQTGNEVTFTSATLTWARAVPAESGWGPYYRKPFLFADTCKAKGYGILPDANGGYIDIQGKTGMPACMVTTTAFAGQTYILNVNP